jgi:oligoendopeptidase F
MLEEMDAIVTTEETNRSAAPPRWSLDDLYTSPDDPELAVDLAEAASSARAFRGKREGTLRHLSGAGLARAIEAYERIRRRAQRVRSYAHLRRAEDALDAETAGFFQNTAERLAAIDRELLFFPLELAAIDEDEFTAKLADPALAGHRAWLLELRRFRPHQLSQDVEALLLEKEVAGRMAWTRLYDEARAGWRLVIGGRARTNVEALACLRHEDAGLRREAAAAFDAVLAQAAPMLTLVFNALARDKAVEDRWRGHRRPIERRNLENAVADDVVEGLFAAVQAAYPRVSHRYYRLKAGWLGHERLPHWDRLAPLWAEAGGRRYGWDEARAIVLGAWRDFSPEFGDLAAKVFDRRWIDAAPRPGKAVSGFTHAVAGRHPYILVNFQGRAEDVLVLAHELGHALHHLLAEAGEGPAPMLPLTLAETASVFGEFLTFRRLLGAETDPRRRRALLARKVEAMLHTSFRQIAYAEFERRFHDERKAGEVTASRLGEIFLETQGRYLGNAVALSDGYALWWGNVGHFVQVPFYLYAYAFGECVATSLFALYQATPDGFAERYRALLAAGGTVPQEEALAPFGLDPAAPGFWDQGLRVIEGFIDELAE